MYHRILVPVDGSMNSNRGLAEAIALATLAEGQIRLVHVLDEPFVAPGSNGVMSGAADMYEVVRKNAIDVIAEATQCVMSAGIAVDYEVLDSYAGRVCELVVAAAKRWSADLIVIGTHGRRGIGRLLLGSDAEQILRIASVPVLLVRLPGAGT
jgi:nucleotide-binding universal stress UspA family protein